VGLKKPNSSRKAFAPRNPLPFRYAALQINAHDPNRVLAIDRDCEEVTLRCRRPDHTAPQPLERDAYGAPSWVPLSGIGDPENTRR
jgi:hypothetical protein